MTDRSPADGQPDDPLQIPDDGDETHAPHEETEELDKSDWPPIPG